MSDDNLIDLEYVIRYVYERAKQQNERSDARAVLNVMAHELAAYPVIGPRPLRPAILSESPNEENFKAWGAANDAYMQEINVYMDAMNEKFPYQEPTKRKR